VEAQAIQKKQLVSYWIFLTGSFCAAFLFFVCGGALFPVGVF
jgi:hypothetical protein